MKKGTSYIHVFVGLNYIVKFAYNNTAYSDNKVVTGL